MKTKANTIKLLRLFSIISLGFILQSCGAFYPYAYYTPADRNSRMVYYQNQESPNKYQSYFKEKAQEYDEILDEDVISNDEALVQKNTADSGKDNVQIIINTVPSYSWGFNHYWDSYYYAPYSFYSGAYSPFFYDSWNYRMNAAYYGAYSYPFFYYGLSYAWGPSWYSPYYSGFSYYHPLYRYPAKSRYYTYQNRGRNNHQRSYYSRATAANYSARTSSAIRNTSPSRTYSDLRNTYTNRRTNSTQNRYNSSVIRSNQNDASYRPSRTRIYTAPSSNAIKTRSSSPVRSYQNAAPKRSYSNPVSRPSQNYRSSSSNYRSSSSNSTSTSVNRSSSTSRGRSSSSRKDNL